MAQAHVESNYIHQVELDMAPEVNEKLSVKITLRKLITVQYLLPNFTLLNIELFI